MADEQPNLTEYTSWCTLEGRAEPTATAARLIKSAARLVESYLRCCTRRGTEGEAEAIRDAIYMQVAFWEENQLTPGAEALKATQVTQASLMGASVHYAGAEQAARHAGKPPRSSASSRGSLSGSLVSILHNRR